MKKDECEEEINEHEGLDGVKANTRPESTDFL